MTGVAVGAVPWRVLNQIACSPSTVTWEWLRSEKDSYRQTMPALHGNAVWQPSPSVKQIGACIPKMPTSQQQVTLSL